MSVLPPPIDPALLGAPAPWYAGIGIDPGLAAQIGAYGMPAVAPDQFQPPTLAPPGLGVPQLEAPMMPAPAPVAIPEVPPPPVEPAQAPLPPPVQSTTPEANGKVIVRDENGQTELITPQEAESRAQQWDTLRAKNAEAQTAAQGGVYKEQLAGDAALQTKQAADWEVTKGELQRRQLRYDQDVDDLAKHGTVDSEAWWKSRSTGQEFAAIFSAAAAGFLQGTKGGSNTAIDAMSRAIDQNIQAQEATLANKRAAIGLEQQGIDNVRGAGMADWEHVQAMRDAAWKGVELKAKVALSAVNPAGVQAANLQQIVTGAQQQRQSIALDVQQKRTQIAVEDHTMKNQDQTTAIARGHLGLARLEAGDRHAEHISTELQKWTSMGVMADPVTGKPLPDGAGGFKRLPVDPNALPSKAESEARKAAAEADAAERNNGNVGDIRYSDGTRVRAQNPEDAKETATQREGLDAYATLVGRMEQIRKKYHGITGRIVNSDEFRQLKSDYATTLLNELKAGGFTRPTDAIEKLLTDKSGGLEPTDFRDGMAGMKEGLEGSITTFNAHLQKYNQDGKTVQKYTPPEFKVEVGKGFTPDEDLTVLGQPPRPDQRAEGSAASFAYVGQQQAAVKELTDNPDTSPAQFEAAIKSVITLMHEGHLPPAEGAALVGQLTAGHSEKATQADIAAQYEPGGRGVMGLK